MRLEIVVPDSTEPERKQRLEELVRQLNADPRAIDEVWFDGGVSSAEDEAIQAKFTPEVIGGLRQIQANMEAGQNFTPGQVRESLDQTLREWKDRPRD